MRGLMMETPLLIPSLLEYAARFHQQTEIVSRTVEGPIHRYTYAEAERRSRRLAKALTRLGVSRGDRIATMAWNGFRHFELYYGISGLGAICHTLNPRLFHDQLVYIVAHAEDSWFFLDLTFVPLLEALHAQMPSVKGFVVMTDEEHMPETSLPNVFCYETLMAESDDDFAWPALDESTASSLCYTSGTTGHPKGALYSHRSTVLHSFGVCMTDTLGLSCRNSVLPVVPMFHANAWGLPYACPMAGCKMVFPGPLLDGASLHELITAEGVDVTAGVPTIWLMLLNHLRETGQRIDSVDKVIIGGSAAPRSMIEAFQNELGAHVLHAWGMTETSPLGTVGTLKRHHDDLDDDAKIDIQLKQGHGIYGVDLRVVDEDGQPQPMDGKSFGELQVKGPWVVSEYYKGAGGKILDDEGWFSTGDVATLDPDGYMQITDRAKDVIKSGGEWISSIDLENEVMSCPGVVEAAVIGVPHPKWDERPLLVVVAGPDSELTADRIRAHLKERIASWWMPDDVVFVDELPHTATGKVSKLTLRERFEDHRLPDA